MRRISHKAIKDIYLIMLTRFDIICRENNFRYTLAYGTLLGAIRHQGFIPWDDDIDILMPRPDYDLFISYCKNKQVDFCVANVDLCGEQYKKYYTKVYDSDTIVMEKNSKTSELGIGVNIDIFPIEGLGDSYEQAKTNFLKQKMNLYLIVASNWKKYITNRSKPILYNVVRLVLFTISRFTKSICLINRVQRFYEKINYETVAYVGCVCTPYREREIFSKKIFENMIDVEFEGRKYQAIAMYDAFLTQIYGNYMDLPPVESRICPHDSEAFIK